MDTTSNALSRILHLLAQNPSVQDKLRGELNAATAGGTADLDYDGLMNLPYLDAVCRETLRVYASSPPDACKSRFRRPFSVVCKEEAKYV